MKTLYSIPAEGIQEEGTSPTGQSHAFFCRTCGEIWARVEVETRGDWNLSQVPCRRHRPVGVVDWDKVPGSISLGDNLRIQDALLELRNLPFPLLRREFLLLAELVEKESEIQVE